MININVCISFEEELDDDIFYQEDNDCEIYGQRRIRFPKAPNRPSPKATAGTGRRDLQKGR